MLRKFHTSLKKQEFDIDRKWKQMSKGGFEVCQKDYCW